MSVGIIGLPNVGKSTLFNSLTSGHANVSNYPFTTVDQNVGVVAVPDSRLEELRRILDPSEWTPCFIQFIDIAGLVRGASQGEGLGNQFLGHIRQVDALLHVIRCFGETDVAHVLESVDPERDVEVVETELLLADLEVLDKIFSKQERIWKTQPVKFAKERERLQLYREQLEAGRPLYTPDLKREAQLELRALGLLTGKPILYVANLSEKDHREDHPRVQELRRHVRPPAEVVVTSAKIEWELQQLEPQERVEFLEELEMTEIGLSPLVPKAYRLLGLITFYTIAHEKLRAWEIVEGTGALQAAGKIHSDMERHFIRAQVVSFEELCQQPSMQELHRLGRVRSEGKDYQVQDGDVIEFLFSS